VPVPVPNLRFSLGGREAKDNTIQHGMQYGGLNV
jgi:hypothetical protein